MRESLARVGGEGPKVGRLPVETRCCADWMAVELWHGLGAKVAISAISLTPVGDGRRELYAEASR